MSFTLRIYNNSACTEFTDTVHDTLTDAYAVIFVEPPPLPEPPNVPTPKIELKFGYAVFNEEDICINASDARIANGLHIDDQAPSADTMTSDTPPPSNP